MRQLIIIFAFLFSHSLYSQTGSLQGTVVDNTGDSISYANVIVYAGDSMITGTQANVHGNYMINKLKPGTYHIKFSFVGLESQTAANVVIDKNKITYLDAVLNGPLELKEVIISH